MLPELEQWAVTVWPPVNFTSARKRLYRLTRVPGMSFGQARPFDGDGFLAMVIRLSLFLDLLAREIEKIYPNLDALQVRGLKTYPLELFKKYQNLSGGIRVKFF